MLSLRRYALYIVLAALFLLTLNHFREHVVARAPFTTTPQKADRDAPFSTHISDPNFSWENVPVRFPVKKLTPLPTQKAKQLPKVQHEFEPETSQQAAVRKERLNAVKETFKNSWKAYRQHAWMKDELAPLSGGSHNPFGGWAATLVDNLDTLWIMGMKDEFEEAVQAAVKIDFRKCTLEQINVFETTIRHLGGLLAAYDLSGDERLLAKAKEVGSMLLVAFDTPNRMPITRWFWAEAFNEYEDQAADTRTLVAEIGSLTMEFTRLSLLTGDPKWYDAVERIVKIFDKQQSKTDIPGMWPVSVNARAADFTRDTLFTLGAMSDSLYEYFPKMHALLGGVDPRYKKLYDGSMAAAIQHTLFRPMTPDDADILMAGSARSHGRFVGPTLQPEGQHLACFAGGMFALGSRLFNTPVHLDIARKLTDGCIWAYRALPSGIMPEVFRMQACADRSSCPWNETAWEAGVLAEYGQRQRDNDVAHLIASKRLPRGFTALNDHRYILRPEAIESVFLLHRITGSPHFADAAWEMFTAITNATTTDLGANAAVMDVSYTAAQVEEKFGGWKGLQEDSMESFWMAETLKYFFLTFAEPGVVSLDEWVFNTEAHPFRRRIPVEE